MQQQQLELSKTGTRYIYEQQVIARYNRYFKLDGYHKESKLGYRNNRGTRRRRCIPVFPSFARRYVTFGEVGIPRRISQRHEGSPSSPSLSHEGIALSLWLAFPPLRRWQAPRRRSPGPFTTFHEEVTGTPTKPTRRSPSKSNNLTVSHSNKSWWRAQHYARMQSKNTKKSAQILLSQIPQKQQMLWRN